MTDIDYMTDLKVEVQVPTAGLQNLIKNPDGDQGAWGWESPVANTFMNGSPGNVFGQTDIFFQTNPTQACYFRSEYLPVAAGRYAVARFDLAQISASHNVKLRFEWYNSAKVLLSSSTQSAAMSAIQTHYVTASLAPANTAYAKLRFDFYNGVGNPSISSWVRVRQVMVATAATSGGFGSIRENVFVDPSHVGTSPPAFHPMNNTMTFMQQNLTVVKYGTTSHKIGSTHYYPTDVYAESEPMAVTAGEYYTGSTHLKSDAVSRTGHVAVQWFVDGAWQPYWYGSTGLATSTSTWVRPSVTMRAPAGATSARLIVHIRNVLDYNEYHYIDGTMFEQTNYLKPYFSGATSIGDGSTVAWAGTANNSKSTATYASAGFDYQPPYAWLAITGSINHIDIDREAFNLGTMSVIIKDKLLDPSGQYTPILKPGKAIRVTHRIPYDTNRNTLFTGKINNAHVDYDKKKKANAQVDSLITISAVDAMADLANQGESRSVANIYELPYILEGKGVPWKCNGITSHYTGTPTIPVINDNLSIADQVVITRDTTRGQAWVDPQGVLQAWDVGWVPQEKYLSDYNPDVTNYMPNPGFESADISLWASPNYNSTIARSTSAFKVGTYGLRLTNTTGETTIGAYFGTTAGTGFTKVQVAGAGIYDISFWVRPSVIMTVRELFAYKQYLNIAANTWTRIATEATAYLYPDGNWYIEAAYSPVFEARGVSNADLAVGAYIDVDDLSVKRRYPHASYSEIDVDWDTDRIINQVEIKHLTPNADGQAEEVPAGTWEDAASVAAYGPKRAVFTVVGSQNLATFASNILSANATPRVRVNSLRVPIRNEEDLENLVLGLDNYTVVTVVYDDNVFFVRVTAIRHSIGADGWFIDLDFATTTSNPAPQYTPAPPVTVYDAVDVTNLAIAGVAGVTSTSLLTRRGNTVDLYIALSHVGGVNANTATLVIPSQHLPINGNNKYFAGMDGATGALVQVYFASNFYFVFNRAAGSATYAHITYLAGP